MERTKPVENCYSEKTSYDLCLRMKIFDFHCVMEKFVFQRCQTQDHKKHSKEILPTLLYHVEQHERK